MIISIQLRCECCLVINLKFTRAIIINFTLQLIKVNGFNETKTIWVGLLDKFKFTLLEKKLKDKNIIIWGKWETKSRSKVSFLDGEFHSLIETNQEEEEEEKKYNDNNTKTSMRDNWIQNTMEELHKLQRAPNHTMQSIPYEIFGTQEKCCWVWNWQHLLEYLKQEAILTICYELLPFQQVNSLEL